MSDGTKGAIWKDYGTFMNFPSTDNREEEGNFRKKAISVSKVLCRAGLRTTIKALTAGSLDDTFIEEMKMSGEAAKELSSLFDQAIENRLKEASKDKESLSKLAVSIGNDKPIIFIIDELDRCKPPFALEIIETVKHFYSVKNITFILVMNRSQMEEAVRYEYGTGIDAEKYLQKFVNLWANLPKEREEMFRCDTQIYLVHCLKRMDFPVDKLTNEQREGIELYKTLVNSYNMSMRDIEQSLTNYAIINRWKLHTHARSHAKGGNEHVCEVSIY